MAEPQRHEMGDLDEIDAESIGRPGQRTFRMLLEKGSLTAALWLEKEQLQGLSMILEQHLTHLPERGGPQAILTLAARFPAHPTIDFKIGRMGVGLEEKPHRIVLTATSVAPEGEVEQRLRCALPSAQVGALAAKIPGIVAAGRPRCPLCGAPIEGTHVCPLSNGHVH